MTVPRGYTILEVLVVTMIVSLLFSLILTGVHNARERSKIQNCQNNLRQLGMAMECYLITFGKYPPAATQDDDNLRPLYPRWCDNLQVFVCIMAGNQVNGPQDLENNASRINGCRGPRYLGHPFHALWDTRWRAEPQEVGDTRSPAATSIDCADDQIVEIETSQPAFHSSEAEHVEVST